MGEPSWEQAPQSTMPRRRYGNPPPSHLGWAVVAVIFFWPLAIPAFIHYSRVDQCFYRNDLAGSIRASENVKRFGALALVIGLGIAVLLFSLSLLGASVHACIGTGC
jgi:hypothetical protein